MKVTKKNKKQTFMCYINIILYEQVNYQIIISILRLARYNVFLQCIHNYIITYFINYYQRSEGIISFFSNVLKEIFCQLKIVLMCILVIHISNSHTCTIKYKGVGKTIQV